MNRSILVAYKLNIGASLNVACPCGSGKSYKRCCAEKRQAAPAAASLKPADITPALNLEKAGQFLQANQLYSTLLLRYVDHPALLWGRGRCLMHMGETGDAAAALSRAAENYAGNQQLLQDASARLILLEKPEAALEAPEPV